MVRAYYCSVCSKPTKGHAEKDVSGPCVAEREKQIKTPLGTEHTILSRLLREFEAVLSLLKR